MFVWQIQCYVYRLSLVSILTCLCESVKKPYRILSYYVSSQGVQRTWNRIHFDFDLGELTTIPLRSIDFGELPYHVPMLGELGVYTVCSIDEGVDSGAHSISFHMFCTFYHQLLPTERIKNRLFCFLPTVPWKLSSKLQRIFHLENQINEVWTGTICYAFIYNIPSFLGSNWTCVKILAFILFDITIPSCHRAPLAQAPKPQC